MPQNYKIFVNDFLVYLRQGIPSLKEIDESYPLQSVFMLSEPIPSEIDYLAEVFETQDAVQNYIFPMDDPDIFFQHLKESYKYIEAAGAVVRNENNELLMIKRRGVWDLPKGKIETKEKPEDAAIRELKEETGLGEVELNDFLADTYHLFTISEKIHMKRTQWFNMSAKSAQDLKPEEGEGIVEVKWIPEEEISTYLENSYRSLRELFES